LELGRRLSRLFISHSSKNDDWAIAIRDWLVDNGWSGEGDIFLDLDPSRGISAGERWIKAFSDAVTRCEAVLFLVSEAWLNSKWCNDEYGLAAEHHKKLFALKIDPVANDRLPGSYNKQWQIITLRGAPAKRFLTVHPTTGERSPVYIAEAALTSLRRGLDRAGVAPNTFDLHPDPQGPKGWRRPYRGLEALEPEDAAVFFGRDADIARGLDTLRGLAQCKPPRMLVVLGASGAGKSSYLRAGLWPRLARDDATWLPLRTIRVARGGAIEGADGLITAIEDAGRRCGTPMSRAHIRGAIGTDAPFIVLINELRAEAAKRALADTLPLVVLCVDQAEEMFTADAGEQGARLLALAHFGMIADAVLLLATIRSDSYAAMQGAKGLTGIHQETLSLGPVPQGEIAQIIRRPAEILRSKPVCDAAVWKDDIKSPVFDPVVVARLQEEIVNEPDALPLLAYALERLMRDHATVPTIGLKELESSGGITAAIEASAEAALVDAKLPADAGQRREALRRLFIPHLARVDPVTRTAQRRVAKESDLPSELQPLARALIEQRLLVKRLPSQAGQPNTAEPVTIEVAHEALLRKWATLTELLAEDRDALLLLDGVLTAASDWHASSDARKMDFLMHRGSRLEDARALARRGPEWAAMMIASAERYLDACHAHENVEINKQRRIIGRAFVKPAEEALEDGRSEHALRLAATGVLLAKDLDFDPDVGTELWGPLRQAILEIRTRTVLKGHSDYVTDAKFSPDCQWIVTTSLDHTARIWDAATGKQIAVLEGHTRAVDSASFSPDGERIVTASADKTARIWDAATGKQIVPLEGHTRAVESASFSLDGRRIVTASYDGTARIWNAATGKQIAALEGHTSVVTCASFSRDGGWIVTASYDNTSRIWDAATGKQIATLTTDTASISSASFSPNGRRIVTWDSTSAYLTVLIWDAATAKQIAHLEGHTKHVKSACFSPDGERIVTGSDDNTARTWDAATGKQIAVLEGHTSAVNSASFSPDGRRIVTASEDNTARIWDAATGKEIGRFEGHSMGVTSASFSLDGRRIVTASFDRTARTWDAATEKQIAALKGHTWNVTSPSFSPDSQRIVTASSDRTACIWDAAAKQIGHLEGHTMDVRSASFSPDGQRIVTASADTTARIWDAATGKHIASLAAYTTKAWSASFSPDSRRILTWSPDRTVRLWDVATANQIAHFEGHTKDVKSACFSPDGERIVTASEDNTARIWEPGKQIAALEGHTGAVNSASFSRDGQRVVTASGDMTARIWDAATGKQIIALEGHTSFVNSASFSPDGRRIVTASYDGTSRIWDAATGKEMGSLEGHAKAVNSASFSPDNYWIVTASEDNSARIWVAATGKQIASLKGHTAGVWSASFSPDGRRIVTASYDGTVRMWDVSRCKIIAGVRSIVLTAALSHGIGWRTAGEQADLLMRDAADDLYAEALKELGRTADDPEISEVAAQLRAPLHINCYLSPTEFAETFPAAPAMPVIGFLNSASPEGYAPYVAAFRQGLKEAGYAEGQSVTIEYRWAEGQYDRLPALAADLVRRKVTVLAATSTPAAQAAREATATIPIVFTTGGDPIRLRLVTSLSRPGLNVTGVSNLISELGSKRLGLLCELVPSATVIATLLNPNFPDATRQSTEVEAAARALGLQFIALRAANEREIDTAFATIASQGGAALDVGADPFFLAHRDHIVALAARYAIPTIYPVRDFAVAGGLMSYGTDFTDSYRQAGVYTGRIVRGEKPADLPVQRSVKFEFVINVKATKALGLSVPNAMQLLADEVIE
jgi:WD40 repeat protein/ABC-type uncharacterized transport system substrate-binding protein